MLRILHMEGDVADAEPVHDLLASDGLVSAIVRVETREEFEAALEEGEFDLILSEMTLPQFDGVTALSIALEKRPDVPFIFVSGTIGEEVAVESVKSGATDYVLKHRLERLLPVTRRALREAAERRQYKQSEEVLNSSLARYRALVEQAADAIIVSVVTDMGPVIEEVNSAACDMFGYSRGELVGRYLADMVSPEDLLKNPMDFEALGVAETVRNERLVLRKDGTTLAVETNTIVLADGRVQSIARDISQRKLAEEALRESEERFQAFWQYAGDAMSISDPEGTVLAANPAYCNLYGYSPEEVIGHNFAIIFPPQVREWAGEEYRRTFADPQIPPALEATIERADGTRRIVEVQYNFAERGGRRTAMISTIRDITERKLAEAARDETLSLLRATLDSTADGILVTDSEGSVTNSNKKFMQMWGVPETLVASRDYENGLEFIIAQLRDPEAFRRTAQDLHGQPDADSFDVMEFKDGRVFERYSRPQQSGENTIGRVWSFRDVTERNRAAEALKESELRYRTLIEHASDGIFLTDIERNLTDVNETGCTMLGYTRDELLRLCVDTIVEPADPETAQVRGVALAAGKTVRAEHRMYRKDGTAFPAEISSKLLPGGKYLGFARDISERKQAADALTASEEKFRAIFDSTQDAIFIFDNQGRYVDVNAAAASLVGIAKAELLGLSLADFEQHALGSTTLSELWRGFTQRGGADSTVSFVTAEGQTRHVEYNSVLNFMPGFHLAIVHDVTESKEAERNLSESEQRFRLAFDHAGIGMVLASLDGRLMQVNHSLAETLGYSEAELLTRTYRQITHPEDLDIDKAYLSQLLEGEIWFYQVEKRYIHKDGHIVWAALSATLVRDHNDEPHYFVAQIQDITERKQAAEALRKANEHLESRVVARTTELRESNNKLQHELIERKRMEQLTIASVERLAEAQSLAQLGSWEWDLVTNEISWSDELFRLFGLEPHQFGVTLEIFMNYVHPDDRGSVRKVIESAVHEKGSFHHESRFVRSDSSTRVCQARGEAVLDQAGKILMLRGTMQDITERKLTEQALFESEQRYRQMFEGNRSVKLLVDPSTCSIMDANPAASSFYGYSVAELKTMTMMDIDLSVHMPEESKVGHLAPGESAALTLQHKLSSGELKDVELYISPVDIGDRRLRYIIVHDITNRKLAESRLRRSEELHRALARNLPNGAVLLFDADLRFQLAEGASLIVQGYRKELLIGKTIWEILPPADVEVLVPYYRAALAGEEKILEREFSGRFYLMHFVPVKDEHGETFAGMVVSLDITEQRRSAEEARLAQGAAEQANKAKSEFLSRMSHELRTPLNAIIGFSQLLEMEALETEQRESVGLIHDAGRQLLSLINEVLEISRIEAGHMLISTEPVSVPHLIDECINLMRPMAAEKNLLVKADANSKILQHAGHVLADRQRIRQVLLNLLANGIKYNREGGGVVLSYREVYSGQLRIEVTDTGCGISEENLEKLFTPFERLGADQAGIEGTGLGLALSRRLIELMGGTIGVESVVGQGCTFWLELPVAAEPLTQTEQNITGPPVLALAQGPQPVTHTLLYIEDNLSNLRLIEQILRHRSDIRMLSAMQGRIGFDLATQHIPDLILLDLHLPDVHGEKVLEWLLDDPRTNSIPVVIVSADATPREVERLLELGACDYITKPIDVKQFVAVVDGNLAGKQVTYTR